MKIPNKLPANRLHRSYGARFVDGTLAVKIIPENNEIMDLQMKHDLLLMTDTNRKGSIYHRNLTSKPHRCRRHIKWSKLPGESDLRR